MVKQNTNDPVLFFDGVCNLCNGVVQWVLPRDAKGRIRFASLQSEAGRQLMLQHGLPEGDMSSFLLLSEGVLHRKSDAALHLMSELRGGWRLLAAFRIVPRPWRDWVYDFVARNRYRWFGRRDSCMIPQGDLRGRFLEDGIG